MQLKIFKSMQLRWLAVVALIGGSVLSSTAGVSAQDEGDGDVLVGISASKDGQVACANMQPIPGYLLPGQPACLYSQAIALRADGYTIRVESKPGSKTYNRVVRSAQTAASALASITSLPFRVGAAAPLGYQPQPGEIVLRPDTYNDRCAPAIACAFGLERWPWITDGDRIDGGQVWFKPDFAALADNLQLIVIEHEIGHVLGLQHYDLVGGQAKINGRAVKSQAMQWDVRFVFPTLGGYQSGDIAGLKRLADFRLRSPDGHATSLTPTSSGFVVNGWMVDPTNPSNQAILVSIDGGPAVQGVMNGSFTASAGNHQVCVTLVNVGAGANKNVECLSLQYGPPAALVYAGGSWELQAMVAPRRGATVGQGKGWMANWAQIVPIDVDGDRVDELLFYDKGAGSWGLSRMKVSGTTTDIAKGDGWWTGWTSITAANVDADPNDEVLFYGNGTWALYDVSPTGVFTQITDGGATWMPNWTQIVAMNVDADPQDELYFYAGGTWALFNVSPYGTLSLINEQAGWDPNWTSITAVNADADANDEALFYAGGTWVIMDVNASGQFTKMEEGKRTWLPGWTQVKGIRLS